MRHCAPAFILTPYVTLVLSCSKTLSSTAAICSNSNLRGFARFIGALFAIIHDSDNQLQVGDSSRDTVNDRTNSRCLRFNKLIEFYRCLTFNSAYKLNRCLSLTNNSENFKTITINGFPFQLGSSESERASTEDGCTENSAGGSIFKVFCPHRCRILAPASAMLLQQLKSRDSRLVNPDSDCRSASVML